jgi:hypothetical protein
MAAPICRPTGAAGMRGMPCDQPRSSTTTEVFISDVTHNNRRGWKQIGAHVGGCVSSTKSNDKDMLMPEISQGKE